MKSSFPLLVVTLLLLSVAALWLSEAQLEPREAFVCGEFKDVRVAGQSLTGITENGDVVKIWYGFQDCSTIKRDDVVVYDFAGYKDPLLKVVKAIPGDSFQIAFARGGVKVFVNNEIVKNAQGEIYLLDASTYNLLSLYVRDYQGVIPQQSYFLLGNIAGTTLDSSRFGLVDGGAIVGKLVQ